MTAIDGVSQAQVSFGSEHPIAITLVEAARWARRGGSASTTPRRTPRWSRPGPFAIVRNPIFAAMLPASQGLALMVPSAIAIAGAVALLIAIELQVRVVEEPDLIASHGERYERYRQKVGRFLPGVGRLHR